MQDKVRILGSDISIWDLEETVQRIGKIASEGMPTYVCISNVHTVVMGMRNPAYAQITNGATLATADGVPLVWASRLLPGADIQGRASGPDIVKAVLADPRHGKLRHYFYGSTPEVLDDLRLGLMKICPDSNLVGFHSPSLRPVPGIDQALDLEEMRDCERINSASPDIVWAGLGAPKQEIWMHRMRPHLRAPVLVGVGAAFDFLSGRKKRAPAWMRRNGLEWLHRFGHEPRRLLGRYVTTNPLFILGVLRQWLLRRRHSQ